MKGQKEYVVELVKHHLPNFVEYKDIALIALSGSQLEQIKNSIAVAISLGTVSYSKNPLNKTEVVAYARSMVMNHMKKARELNGNQVYGKTKSAVESKKKDDKLATVDMESLPDDLKSYVNSIV
jgi:hypothetical protein